MAPSAPPAAGHGGGAPGRSGAGSALAFADTISAVALAEAAPLAALEEATAAGILRHSGPYDFVFSHDMIREALVEAMSPFRLRKRIGERPEASDNGALARSEG